MSPELPQPSSYRVRSRSRLRCSSVSEDTGGGAGASVAPIGFAGTRSRNACHRSAAEIRVRWIGSTTSSRPCSACGRPSRRARCRRRSTARGRRCSPSSRSSSSVGEAIVVAMNAAADTSGRGSRCASTTSGSGSEAAQPSDRSRSTTTSADRSFASRPRSAALRSWPVNAMKSAAALRTGALRWPSQAVGSCAARSCRVAATSGSSRSPDRLDSAKPVPMKCSWLPAHDRSAGSRVTAARVLPDS